MRAGNPVARPAALMPDRKQLMPGVLDGQGNAPADFDWLPPGKMLDSAQRGERGSAGRPGPLQRGAFVPRRRRPRAIAARDPGH